LSNRKPCAIQTRNEDPGNLRLTVHEVEAIPLKQHSTRAESSQLLPAVDLWKSDHALDRRPRRA